MKILLIGPNPPPLGGTTVSFQNLVNELKEITNISIQVVNSSGVRGKGVRGVLKFLTLLSKIYSGIKSSEVITLHISTSGLHILGPIVVSLSRFLKKPVIIRKFGGGDYINYKGLRFFLINWSIKCSKIYLVETKTLLTATQKRGLNNVRWFSNSRHMPEIVDSQDKNKLCNNFVYIGDVRKEKGIELIFKAFNEINSQSIKVDIYGPLFKDINENIFKTDKRINYKGILNSSEVISTLLQYDALIFPTYCFSEGYPGVILEAYSAGLPIISTRLRSIQEIVDDSVGILIEPKNYEELKTAILKLIDCPDIYNNMRRNVISKRDEFSQTTWINKFIDYCSEAIS